MKGKVKVAKNSSNHRVGPVENLIEDTTSKDEAVAALRKGIVAFTDAFGMPDNEDGETLLDKCAGFMRGHFFMIYRFQGDCCGPDLISERALRLAESLSRHHRGCDFDSIHDACTAAGHELASLALGVRVNDGRISVFDPDVEDDVPF